MAVRSVATTNTLEEFRTTFNSLGTDVGDLTTLGTTDKSSIVAAINEVNTAVTTAFTITDDSANTQTINSGNVFTISSGNNITATVSATDTLTVGLNNTITGLTSVSSTSITDGTATLTSGSLTGVVNITGTGTANFTTDVQVNGVSVGTKAFAIAQAVALG